MIFENFYLIYFIFLRNFKYGRVFRRLFCNEKVGERRGEKGLGFFFELLMD